MTHRHRNNWIEIDAAIGEKTYRSSGRDLLYIEDTYQVDNIETQTEIEDWHGDRYAVKLRRNYRPPETDDKVLHTTMNWEEAENFLESEINELE